LYAMAHKLRIFALSRKIRFPPLGRLCIKYRNLNNLELFSILKYYLLI
jgi:hypothetical protein